MRVTAPSLPCTAPWDLCGAAVRGSPAAAHRGWVGADDDMAGVVLFSSMKDVIDVKEFEHCQKQ